MDKTESRSISGLKTVLGGIILILLLIHLAENGILFLAVRAFVQNPNIPKFRLVSAAVTIVVSILFLIVLKPAAGQLGLAWAGIPRRTKILYCAGGAFVLLLVFSSTFIMADIKYFALATNLNFGLTTPVFEETLFRGYCWDKLRTNRFSNLATLIVTSVIFGFFHLGYYYQIEYATRFHPDAPPMVHIMLTKVLFGTVLGFLMGWIRWKSKKVYGSIILHAILNIMGK